MLPKKNNCPYLLLAPMEGVGERCFRKAIAIIGGFDEAVREFLRVPSNAHIKSLASVYEPEEIAPFPLAAQIMGSDPELMAQMAHELMLRGALRIDVNCGCPSNTVTGRGAGSSLLKDPELLHEVVSAVVKAVPIAVTVKMRSGYEDIRLFDENMLAAQSSGVRYITLHPRTKVEGYSPPARWDLIARAKALLDIPVIGNGDILLVDDAVKILAATGCDALMIGRGSIINPFIFQQIRAFYAGYTYKATWENLAEFLEVFLFEINIYYPQKLQVNKLKQLLGFLFKYNNNLIQHRQQVLRSSYADPRSLLAYAAPLLQEGFL